MPSRAAWGETGSISSDWGKNKTKILISNSAHISALIPVAQQMSLLRLFAYHLMPRRVANQRRLGHLKDTLPTELTNS